MSAVDRAEYVAGLRRIADALEADPSLPLPYEGASGDMGRLSVFTSTREELQAWSRVMDGVKRKDVDNDAHYGFRLLGAAAGVNLIVYADRQEVCRRVVTGTREVTRTVPDLSVQVPMVEVTETVEDVDWICEPLLAEVTS